MELSDEQLEEIRRLARPVRFGRVHIEVNEEQGKVDVVVENRHRISHRGVAIHAADRYSVEKE